MIIMNYDKDNDDYDIGNNENAKKHRFKLKRR